jgi:hypothetical protein
VPWSSLPSGGGGGGMSIGGAVTGATPGSVLFIDSSGNLAQDNLNLFWDEVAFSFKVDHTSPTISGSYYLNGLPSLFEIPNASGNNWFEGNAGNRSVSGYGNFGTGDGVLASVTSGNTNVAIGAAASGYATGGKITSGSGNTALGAGALALNTTGVGNLAIGSYALFSSNGDGYNVAIGAQALANLAGGGTGNDNVGLGRGALQAETTGTGSIAIGALTGNAVGSSSYDIFIGYSAGQNVASSNGRNIFIGTNAGQSVSSATYSTIIGPWNTSSSLANAIIFSGYAESYSGFTALNCNWTFPSVRSVWSFTTRTTSPAGIHLYNSMDTDPPSNYERSILDWNPTANVFRVGTQAGGTGIIRLVAVDGFQKAGAPAAGDLPSGTMALINDTSGGQTWLCYNAAGTIRKVQLT